MAKTSVAIDRKIQKKRNKQSIGYTIFYSVLLAGLTVAITFVLAAYAGSLPIVVPRFLYDSIVGILYVYNAVSLVLIWLTAFLFPRPYQFQSLADNSWNMLYKFGVKPGKLARGKINGNVFSQLFTYIIGFAFSGVFAYLKSSDRTLNIKLIAFLALVGIFSVLIIVMPTIATGAITRGRIGLRLVILLVGAFVGYLLYSNGYHLCASVDDIAASTAKLISLNPLGLVLIGVVFSILFPIIALSSAVSRIKDYNVEDQDEDDLIDLGINSDTLVLTRGRSRYLVAISGPDINGSDTDIEIPPLDDDDGFDYSEPESKPSKKKKRSRRKNRDDDDEDDEEYVE